MQRILHFCFYLLILSVPSYVYAQTGIATFAGGCFWSTEHDFEKVPGVLKVVSGYTGGNVANPSYEKVVQGGTGHLEAVQVYYDTSKIDYQQLLNTFWHNIDPTDTNGQFCDQGFQYQSAIFYSNDQEKKMAEESKQRLNNRFKRISTQILPLKTFYPAEEYHQDYAKKHPVLYKIYRSSCGRDRRLQQLWQ